MGYTSARALGGSYQGFENLTCGACALGLDLRNGGVAVWGIEVLRKLGLGSEGCRTRRSCLVWVFWLDWLRCGERTEARTGVNVDALGVGLVVVCGGAGNGWYGVDVAAAAAAVVDSVGVGAAVVEIVEALADEGAGGVKDASGVVVVAAAVGVAVVAAAVCGVGVVSVEGAGGGDETGGVW